MSDVITSHLDLWTSALFTKSSAGRGSNGKQETYGIKKLRELILELAVRGKLVPQDPNDEPATELLKRVAADKARMVMEGIVRKGKTFPPIADDEIPFNLPEGWKWVRINDVGHDWGQKTPDATFTYIDVSAIDNSAGVISSPTVLSASDAPSRARKIVQRGTVIFSTVRPYLKNICVIEEDYEPESIASTAFAILHPLQGMPGRFFAFYFRSPIFVKYVESVQTGIAYPAITDKQFYGALVPIPPLAEQHRIVAKVDELMALCDQLEQQQTHSLEAHQTLVETLLGTLTRVASPQELTEAWTRIANHFDTLFTTEHSIDQLKQTILQLAVMGKLVPQDPNDEPTKKLLRRKEEMDDEAIPFKIPKSWVWARVEEIAQTRLGKMLDKAKNKGTPFRYLRNINVRWFDFDLSDVKEMRFEDPEREEFSLRRGDVLICEGGYPGRAAVWDEREDNIYFQKAIHRVRFGNGVNPNYFVYVLRESADSGRLNSYFTGASIQHFTGKGLMSFLVPLPPLSEQHRIVAKVDELMALCDVLKARLADAQTTQIHLADAMVEQAVANCGEDTP